MKFLKNIYISGLTDWKRGSKTFLLKMGSTHLKIHILFGYPKYPSKSLATLAICRARLQSGRGMWIRYKTGSNTKLTKPVQGSRN